MKTKKAAPKPKPAPKRIVAPKPPAPHTSLEPTPAVLDALAAIARRMDRFITEGVSNDLQSRIRTRLDTPGLREWIAARLVD